MSWLNRAIDTGYRDLAELDAEVDFEALRDSPRFRRIPARRLPDEPERHTCYRHPTTSTALACARCHRPICVACAAPTATGWSLPRVGGGWRLS